jgi:hypothetical protein
MQKAVGHKLMMDTALTSVPWLQRFEDDWAAEWLLKKLIDQRVHDRNQASAKKRISDRKREMLEHRGGR